MQCMTEVLTDGVRLTAPARCQAKHCWTYLHNIPARLVIGEFTLADEKMSLGAK